MITGSIRGLLCLTSHAAICCLLALPAKAQSSDQAAAALAAEGQQAMAQGRMADARASFEKLAHIDPSIAEVHATLAAIDFKLRDYDAAIGEIRTAQKLKPSLPRLDSLLGLSLAELGHFDEALPKLEHGFRQSADPMTRRLCGLQLLRAYTGLGRDSDAVETALALNKLYPDDPEVLYHTGRIYGNYAYITMEKLQSAAPDSIWMLQARGEANESQKNYTAAIDAFNHVLSLDPRRPGIHYRLGRVYLARFTENQDPRDRDAAMREFSAELETDPRNGNAAYELANIAAQSGDLEHARQGFEAVLQKFPDFEEALVGLGGVLLDGQTPKDAVEPLERAAKIRPDDEVAWYRLSQAERAAGNREGQESALVTFRKLHSSTPVGLRKPGETGDVTPQQLGAVPEP
ncbi:MAG TPA: tetratricopeptide repeat protein [Terracidiphilus sp.]|nr:tetratricopeptide repeat protein [Terracidiphilus sp.]